MKYKFRLLLLFICLICFQNAEAQLFKRMKQRAKAKARQLENNVLNKAEKEAEKTINDAIEGKNDPNADQQKTSHKKDFGEVIIKHSKTYGDVQISEIDAVKVTKTNAGYTINGKWWSHEADIYDGFTITITTDKNLQHDDENAKNNGKQFFRIPEDASMKLGYDPQLPYNKKPEGNFKRAVTDDYQNYEITKGEIIVEVLTAENIQISFSGTVSLREVVRKNTSGAYTENFYEATISGGIDGKKPKFINQQAVTNTQNTTTAESSGKTIPASQSNQTTTAIPGIYNFTHETITQITVPKQNRSYKMSYLLNPNAAYIGIKADMAEYSSDEMDGESIIVMDKGNTHIFVETSGMKMRMSNSMAGKQMNNPTEQMTQYDYSKLQKTGNTKTILGATCYEYTMSDDTVKVNFWVAPSIKLSNWFIQQSGIIDGYIMEYTVVSNEGTMTSKTIAINDNITKTINPKEYKKMF